MMKINNPNATSDFTTLHLLNACNPQLHVPTLSCTFQPSAARSNPQLHVPTLCLLSRGSQVRESNRRSKCWSVTQKWLARGVSWGDATLLFYTLAVFTRKSLCALVDIEGGFDCIRAESAGMVLDKALWICCKRKRAGQGLRSFQYTRNNKAYCSHNNHSNDTKREKWQQPERPKPLNSAKPGQSHKLNPLEQAFKATDILLHNGGFGLIAVDLSSIDEARLRKVPLTTWFRFTRVADETQTALIFLTSSFIMCSSIKLKVHINGGLGSWSRNEMEQSEGRCAPGNLTKTNCQLQGFWEPTLSYLPHRDTNSWQNKLQHGRKLLSLQRDLRAKTRPEYFCHINVLQTIHTDIEIKHGKNPAKKFSSQDKYPIYNDHKDTGL